MTTEPTAKKFDDAALRAAIAGTWEYPNENEPEGRGLLHFTEDGRFFEFIFNEHRPEKRLSMRVWWTLESEKTLRVQPNKKREGWTRDFRFEGETLIITATSERVFSLKRTPPESIPVWFKELLAANSNWPEIEGRPE